MLVRRSSLLRFHPSRLGASAFDGDGLLVAGEGSDPSPRLGGLPLRGPAPGRLVALQQFEHLVDPCAFRLPACAWGKQMARDEEAPCGVGGEVL
jgi:hypothetical protein